MIAFRQMQCGVFDSRILRKNMPQSPVRTVRHYELELMQVAGGVSNIDRGAYPVRRGMLLAAGPGMRRFSRFPIRCSFIRLEPGALPQETKEILHALPLCTYLESEEEIGEMLGLFEALSGCLLTAAPPAAVRVRANALLYDILYHWLRQAASEPVRGASPPAARGVREAYEYINEHYAEDCTLDQLAAAVHLSPNYLHTAFREAVGKTPYQYTLERRIEAAKRLISAGEKSMAEIAEATGFCSQSHFNKHFKAFTGLTPVAYRQNLLNIY